MRHKTQTYLLTRIGFVIALFLLLLNDFFLKSQFHNAFTGKLSDIAGLFAFAYFLSIFFRSKKNIRCVYAGTALFFVFWKSEYSAGFIELLNISPFYFGRVVDYTDLWALLILPFSYYYRISEKENLRKWHPVFKYNVLFVSCFSFVATSSLPIVVDINLKSEQSYFTALPKDSVIKKLRLYKEHDSLYSTLLHVNKRNSTVDINVVLDTTEPGSTRIKLDSILSFRNRDHALLSIFDTSKRDIRKMKKLKIEDYEILFKDEKIAPIKE